MFRARYTIGWPSFAFIFVFPVVLVAVHETLHLLAFPGGGVGSSVIGFWPARGAAYVLYTLPTTRDRFIVATLAPVLIISIGLLVAASLGVRFTAAFQWASVVNAFASGADLLVVSSLLRQSVPSDLVVESGQQLYVRVS